MSVKFLINNTANPLIYGACMQKEKRVKLAGLHFLPLSLRNNILLLLQTAAGLMHLLLVEKTYIFFSSVLKVCWPCFLSNMAEAADQDCCCWFPKLCVLSPLIFLYKASQIIDLLGLISWRRLTMKHRPEKIFCSDMKYLFETQQFVFTFQGLSFLSQFKC